jgi:addiction module HigA family antidote
LKEARLARTPIHPGEHLAEELKELGISAAELARQIEVPVNRITAIINAQRGVTADTALRLGHWFGSTCRSSTSCASRNGRSVTSWPSCRS